MPPVICWCCKAEIEAKAAGCASCACLLLVRGKYRILGLLGEGGMGVVYEVEDVEKEALVALKTLSKIDAETRAEKKLKKFPNLRATFRRSRNVA